MSTIPLSEARDFLDVIGTAHDAKLQPLLDGAEQEALDFMNRRSFAEICVPLPEDDPDYQSEWEAEEDVMSEVVSTYGMPSSVRTGVLFLLQAAFQATPKEAADLRIAAERALFPYRCHLGV